MKGAISFHGLRGKQLSLILIALICVSILLWAWEKTPVITILPQESQIEILSPDTPTDDSISLKQNVNLEEGFSNPTYVKEEGTEVNKQAAETRTERTDQEEKGGSNIVAGVYKEAENSPEKIEDKDSMLPMEEKGENSPEKIEDKDSMLPMEEKVVHTGSCNYGKGKWVADSRRPLYSGFGCKQWLSDMWACRLTQRTDFSYEKFRWQPENCETPEFDGSQFLKRMQDKTIALVGDSLGRQQFQSLMCMVTGGKESREVKDIGKKYGLVKARGAIRPDGWAYWFPRTNTTILYYWSASLCELEPLNISDAATNFAMHLDRPATFLRQYLHSFDVLVLNTGHHWNRGKINANRWVMYVGGAPNTNRKIAEIGNAKNLTIYSVAKWLDSQLPQHPQLKAFFRTLSPRHFVNGDWNTGGSCDNTTPLAGGSEVTEEESSDLIVAGAVKGTGIKLLDITALSQLRDEGHVSKYSIKSSEGVHDCLHWCLPGIPDTWNEILYAQLLAG